MRTIVVILARAGSVRLPGKNVAPFAGKPMIAWTFDRALALRAGGLADAVAVSTDDVRVQQIAPEGIEVITRPPELATATASSFDAMAHAVAQIEGRTGPAQQLVLLQPTSPLASPQSTNDLVATARAHASPACTAIASLADRQRDLASIAPEWHQGAKGNGVRRLPASDQDKIWPIERVADAAATHLITGAVYVVAREAFFRHRGFFPPPPDTLGFVVPAVESIDVDTPLDFAVADAVVRAGKSRTSPL